MDTDRALHTWAEIADAALPRRTPKWKRKAVLLATCPEHGFDLRTNGWYQKPKCDGCEIAWNMCDEPNFDADLWILCIRMQKDGVPSE